MHWEQERMNQIHHMNGGPEYNAFRVNDRVKSQIALKLGEVRVPQWSLGTIKSINDGALEVEFDHFGSHVLGLGSARQSLLHLHMEQHSERRTAGLHLFYQSDPR
jgi:hypothetical protein